MGDKPLRRGRSRLSPALDGLSGTATQWDCVLETGRTELPRPASMLHMVPTSAKFDWEPARWTRCAARVHVANDTAFLCSRLQSNLSTCGLPLSSADLKGKQETLLANICHSAHVLLFSPLLLQAMPSNGILCCTSNDRTLSHSRCCRI